MDQEVRSFDFSRCHPIREQLLNELLTMHRRDNARRSKWQGLMSDDELDMAVAAGSPALQAQEDKK